MDYMNYQGLIKPINFMYLLQVLLGCSHVFKDKQLFCFWYYYTPVIFLIKPEAVEELLNDPKFNNKGWIYNLFRHWMGDGAVTCSGEKSKHQRKFINSSFRIGILKEYLPIFNEKSMKLVKILEKETHKLHSNLFPSLQLCSLDIICASTFGIDIEAQERNESQFVESTTRIIRGALYRFINPMDWLEFVYKVNPKNYLAVRDLRYMKELTLSIVRERKKNMLENDGKVKEADVSKQNNLLEVLLKHHLETKELTDEDIQDEVNTFITAGYDTLSQATSMALYLIGLDKDVQNKIQEELDVIFGDDMTRPVTNEDLNNLKYLECVIKESLRLFPSVPVFARQVGKDTKICGCSIPDGAMVIVFAYQLHRDEKHFPNSEKFDPDRFLPENCKDRHPYAYVPFSMGMRNCIGQKFAMMEAKVILANILRNYCVQSLDQRDKIEIALEITLKTSSPIRIKIRSRNEENNNTPEIK